MIFHYTLEALEGDLSFLALVMDLAKVKPWNTVELEDIFNEKSRPIDLL